MASHQQQIPVTGGTQVQNQEQRKSTSQQGGNYGTAMQQYTPSQGGLFSMFNDPLFGAFDSMLGFPGGFQQGALGPMRAESNLMRLNVRENEQMFEITADIPGVKKEDVKVELDAQNVLHISTDSHQQREESGQRAGWTFHRMERSTSWGHRSLKLPNSVDSSRIDAKVDCGVLRVQLPKQAQSQQEQRKTINIA